MGKFNKNKIVEGLMNQSNSFPLWTMTFNGGESWNKLLFPKDPTTMTPQEISDIISEIVDDENEYIVTSFLDGKCIEMTDKRIGDYTEYAFPGCKSKEEAKKIAKQCSLYVNQSRLNQGKNDIYTIAVTRRDRTSYSTGTLEELIKKHGYTLEKGKSWEHEKNNKKINKEPKNINALITNLYNSENNAAANGYSGVSFELVDNSENPDYNKNQSIMNQSINDKYPEKLIDSLLNNYSDGITNDNIARDIIEEVLSYFDVNY